MQTAQPGILAEETKLAIGEKAEDVFYVCDESGEALDEQALAKLKEALLERLDDSPKQQQSG